MVFSFNVFSEGIVCLIPNNNQISEMIKRYLPDENITFDNSFSNISYDSLLSSDKRLYEYIKKNCHSDVIVIPIAEKVSGFTHNRLFVYKDGNITKVYESLENKSTAFPSDVILKLVPYLTDRKLGLLRINNMEPGTAVYIDSKPAVLFSDSILLPAGSHTLYFANTSYSSDEQIININQNEMTSIEMVFNIPQYHNLNIDSSVSAEVFKDGVSIGRTPMNIESYSLPLLLRFTADGYSDRIVAITEPEDSLFVNLNLIEFADSQRFKKVQNGFYKSFMRSILLYGSVAALRGSVALDSDSLFTAEKILKYGLAASLVDVGYDLFKYYKAIKNIAP